MLVNEKKVIKNDVLIYKNVARQKKVYVSDLISSLYAY